MVHFVGAGPGASDLITVRGDRLLRRSGRGDLCRVPCKSGAFEGMQNGLRGL